MRTSVVVAVIALTGFSTLASASVSLLTSPGIETPVPVIGKDETPVYVLEPATAALAPIASVPLAPQRVVETVASALARESERVDRLPTFLLLPDGALVVSLEPLDGALHRDVLIREPLAAPADPAPSAPARDNAALLRRTESPGAPEDLASPRGFAPAPAPEDAGVRAFQPAQPRASAPVGMILTGGLALGALAGIALLLYHRIRPNAALENETRKLIFDSVCQQPGLGVHEISRIAGVSYSTATYHLERLIGAGMIVMTPDGNKLCYYKNGGAFSENERRILPLFKNEEALKLFEAILDAPGTYRAALAEKLGVTATTINWHLRRLRDAGLVDEMRSGRSAHLYARVDALRPTFLTLAVKVEGSEPVVAQKLRRYADEPTQSAGAA